MGTRQAMTAVMALALVLAGCGGADVAAPDSATSLASDDAGPAPTMEFPAVDAEAAEADRSGRDVASGDGEVALPTAATLGRRVIRTATLELRDADPGAVADALHRTVEQAGGFVATADLRRDDEGVLSGTLTARVPADRLDTTLDDLEALADQAPVRRIEEQDVTVEHADLRAQVRNLTAYEDELRNLLAEVGETDPQAEELLRVFERIREVRGELDRLQGRLDVLDDQVALASIRVDLRPTAGATPVADPGWAPGETVRAALGAAARTLTAVADAAIWVGLAVLPVVAVVVLPILGAWALWRRLSGSNSLHGHGDGGEATAG